MLINKVVLKDFFRYYGIQEIDCSIEKDKNVVVIIGENGRGKTTLLTAFNWVFYDDIAAPLTVNNLLNNRKRREMEIGEEEEASVSIFFEEGGSQYKIVRRIRFKKDLSGIVKHIHNKDIYEIYQVEENGDQRKLPYKSSTQSLLIPKDLRGFFFFDGERINRLAKVDGKKEIKNAILNVLGISFLDNTTDHLKYIKDVQMERIKRYKQNSPNESHLVTDHDNKLKTIENLEKEMETLNLKLKENNETIEKLSKIIGEANEETIRDLEKSNVEMQEKIKELKEKVFNVEKQIKKHIASNFKYYLMNEYVDDIDKLLEEKRRKGTLPSGIKDTFIDELIERGICICGSCLEEGSEEYKNVLNMKRDAGCEALDAAYFKLKNLISTIKNNYKNFYEHLNYLESERNGYKRLLFDCDEELKDIKRKLSNSDSESIKEASRMRELCNNDNYTITKKIGILEKQIEENKRSLQEIERTLIQTRSINKEVEELQKKLDITKNLMKLNNDFRNMFIDVVRDELDKRIKDVYSQITNKEYRVPVLTDKFELKVLSKLNEYENEYMADEEVLSTGEGQITSLSFIGALVSYARDTQGNKILSKLSGAEYPIVMDSPFGNLDEEHTRNVAANISKLSSQVVIVVSKKQWEGHVKDNIKENVIRIYKMIDGDDIESKGEYTEIIEEDI